MSDEVAARVRTGAAGPVVRRQRVLRVGQAGRGAADRAGGDRGRAADRDAVEGDVRADRGRADRRRGARAGAGGACRSAARRSGPSTARSCSSGSPGGCRRDVRVWALREAPSGFNARFSAVWRRYAYRVTDNPGGVDPLLRGHVLWHDWPLDVDAMNEAAAAAARGARLRRLLQEAGGRHHHPYAPGAEPGARGRRGHHRDRAGRRLLPQHGALADRGAAVRGGRAPAGRVAGEGAGRGRAGLRRACRTAARADAGGGRLPGRRAAGRAEQGGAEQADVCPGAAGCC